MRSALPPRVCDVGHRQNAGSVKLRRPRDELRNHPGNRDDFDVIGPDGKIVGRILKPGGGADHWQWCLSAVVPRPLRNTGTAPTRDEAAAAFRATWEQWLTVTRARRPKTVAPVPGQP